MKRVFIFLMLLFSNFWAIEVDIDMLKQEVEQNPQDVNMRLILVRSYISASNYDEADKILSEVLKIDSSNKKAYYLTKEVKKLRQIESLVKHGKLTDSDKLTAYLKRLSDDGQYKYITMLGDVMKRNNIPLSFQTQALIVDSYVEIGAFDKALKVLDKSDASQQDMHLLLAKIAKKKQDYIAVEQEYKNVLSLGNNKEAVLGLHQLYTVQGRVDEAKVLEKKYTDTSIKKALSKEKQKITSKRLDSIKQAYEKEGTFLSLKTYYYALENSGDKKDGYKVFKKYLKKHPNDEKARLFLAKQLSWDKKIKSSLSVLNPVINRTKNQEIVSLYIELLNASNQQHKTMPYIKRLANLGDGKSKEMLQKIETNSILDKAVQAHRAKDYETAVMFYKEYYQKSGDTRVAKDIAELSFELKQEKEALPFYEAYLKENDDNKIRFRYASALDGLKMYDRAEVQYRKVAQAEDTLYPLATYRYASSLIAQKSEEKWNHSRAVLQNLLQTLEGMDASKERNDLMRFTVKTLEKVSKPMPKPIRYKDVILAEGQTKHVNYFQAFSSSEIFSRDISSVKSMLKPIDVSVKEPNRKDITFSLYSLEDETISNLAYGVRLNKVTDVASGTLSLEVKNSRFKTAQLREDATSFMSYFNYKDFSVGMGMSSFEDFNEMLTELSYRKIISGHDMTFGLKSSNGAFVNGRACMVKEKINVVQLSLYDAILLSNLEQAELGVTLNRYDDDNINLNSWVEYPIYKVGHSNFESDFAFSGSYEYNTKTDTCYNPAKFYDGNFLQVRPKLIFGKKGFIQGIGAVGYSFENSDFLYNYGLSAEYALTKFLNIRVDCRHYQSGYSPDGADECYATTAYIW